MPRESPAVSTGSSVSESGAGDGVSVIGHLAVALPARAVMVSVVIVVTGLVWIENWVPPAPAGMTTVAGTVASGEELDTLTANPPAGARPSQNPAKQPTSRSTIPNISSPPVAFTGNSCMGVSFRAGGAIVMVVETDDALYVAVTVTGVGVVT